MKLTHSVWTGTLAIGTAACLGLAGLAESLAAPGDTNHVWYAGGRIYSSPAIAPNGTVYVGSTNGCLYAFNSLNGATQHVWNLGDKIFASPTLGTNGTIYIGCDNNNFYALQPDGSTQHVWSCGDRLVGMAAIARDGTIYAGCADGFLYAFHPDGTTQRTWHITQMETAFVSSPAISTSGMICVGGYSSNVYLFHPNGTTQRVWEIGATAGFDASPVFGTNGHIYIGDGGGTLYDLNPADGSIAHTWDTPGGIYASVALGSNGALYVGDTKSNFFAFNPDGTTQRVWTLARDIYGSAAVGSDGTIYVGDDSGLLYGLHPNGTTSVVFQLANTGYRIQGSPAIGLDGSVWIGQYDGTSFFSLQGTGGRLGNTPWPKFGQNMAASNRRLGPPSGLAALPVVGTNKVTVVWSNEPYAIGYEVFKNTSGNPNTAVRLGSTRGQVWTDTGVVPVLTNYYWVRSTNAVFTSSLGTPTTIVRPILPPTGPYASQGDYTDKIVVTWSASPDAFTYRVFASTNPLAAAAVLVGETNGLSFSDTSAPAGVQVYYRIKARAFGAVSPYSDPAPGWRGITALSASDGTYADRIALSWTAVSGAHGYTVLRGLSNHVATATELTGTAATTYDDTTPTAGTYYYYWVRATNDSGLASLSTGDRGWRATGNPPGAPTGLAATKGTHADKVALGWTEADEANGYTVYRGLTASSGDATAVGATADTAFDDTNAVAGTTYYYWLKATNAYGASAFSSSDTGWRAAGLPPEPPASVTASEGTYQDKVAVGWSASAGADGYTVWRGTGSDTNSAELLGSASGAAFDDATAAAEASYYYWVRATNAYGSSGFGSGAWGWRQLQDPPSPPAGVAATDGTYTDRVRVNWDAANGVSSYSVWRAATNDSSAASQLTSGLGTNAYDDMRPTVGRRFWYFIKAENEGGASGFSVPDQGHAKSPVASSLGVNDYNGDGKADLAIFDNVSGSWYILEADGTLLVWAEPWGWPGANPVPGDYDGDRVYDLAVFDNNTGNWYAKSVGGSLIAWARAWGWRGADPVYGDYDGDGTSDLAVFDENTGYWYIYSLEAGLLVWARPWGWPGADTVPGDFDADGLSDLAVFDQNTGYWYVLRADGTLVLWAQPWGWPGAKTVPGDYDGDGTDDLAVFDNNTGYWYILRMDGSLLVWARPWGWPGAVPVPGDYDGDNMSDLAVFDQNTGFWYILKTDGTILVWARAWGWPGATVVGGRR